jgi:hypothetical protein
MRMRWFRLVLTVVLVARGVVAAAIGVQDLVAVIASIAIAYTFFFTASVVGERILVGGLKREVGMALLMGLTLLLVAIAYAVGRVNT